MIYHPVFGEMDPEEDKRKERERAVSLRRSMEVAWEQGPIRSPSYRTMWKLDLNGDGVYSVRRGPKTARRKARKL